MARAIATEQHSYFDNDELSFTQPAGLMNMDDLDEKMNFSFTADGVEGSDPLSKDEGTVKKIERSDSFGRLVEPPVDDELFNAKPPVASKEEEIL